MSKRSWVGALLIGAVLQAAVGCTVAADSEEAAAPEGTLETEESLVAAGPRCTVSGDPPVTQGCGAGETCRIVACTNSIPPSCWGTCVPSGCLYGVAKDCCGNLVCRPGPKVPPPCPIFCPIIE
jgi:hypothetical protein